MADENKSLIDSFLEAMEIIALSTQSQATSTQLMTIVATPEKNGFTYRVKKDDVERDALAGNGAVYKKDEQVYVIIPESDKDIATIISAYNSSVATTLVDPLSVFQVVGNGKIIDDNQTPIINQGGTQILYSAINKGTNTLEIDQNLFKTYLHAGSGLKISSKFTVQLPEAFFGADNYEQCTYGLKVHLSFGNEQYKTYELGINQIDGYPYIVSNKEASVFYQLTKEEIDILCNQEYPVDKIEFYVENLPEELGANAGVRFSISDIQLYSQLLKANVENATAIILAPDGLEVSEKAIPLEAVLQSRYEIVEDTVEYTWYKQQKNEYQLLEGQNNSTLQVAASDVLRNQTAFKCQIKYQAKDEAGIIGAIQEVSDTIVVTNSNGVSAVKISSNRQEDNIDLYTLNAFTVPARDGVVYKWQDEIEGEIREIDATVISIEKTYLCDAYVGEDYLGSDSVTLAQLAYGISRVENYYQATMQQNDELDDGEWKTTPSETKYSEEYKYLWNYEVVYGEALGKEKILNQTTATLSAVWGEQGTSGAEKYTISLDEDFIAVPTNAEGIINDDFNFDTITPQVFLGDGEVTDWDAEKQSDSQNLLYITVAAPGANAVSWTNNKKVSINKDALIFTSNKSYIEFKLYSKDGDIWRATARVEIIKTPAGENGEYVYALADSGSLKLFDNQYIPSDVYIRIYRRKGSHEPVVDSDKSYWYKIFKDNDANAITTAPIEVLYGVFTVGVSESFKPTQRITVVIYADAACTIVVDKVTIDIVQDGTPGDDATDFNVTASSYVLSKDINGVYKDDIILTAHLVNIVGTVDWYKGETLLGTGETYTIRAKDIKDQDLSGTYTAQVRGTDWTDYIKLGTVFDGPKGDSAISIVLSNPSVTFHAGTPNQSETCQVIVYEGGKTLSYSDTNTVGCFKITNLVNCAQNTSTPQVIAISDKDVAGSATFTVTVYSTLGEETQHNLSIPYKVIHDGTGVTIKGSAYTAPGITLTDTSIGTDYLLYKDAAGATQITNPQDNDSYIVNGYLLVYSGTDNNFTCVGKIRGPEGAKGRGVSTIVNYYMASARASGVVAGEKGETADEEWTPGIQTVTNEKPYLWNYEVVLYTDGNSVPTDPVILGNYAKDGKGISAINEYYCITSGTTCDTPSEAVLNSAGAAGDNASPDTWYTTTPFTTPDYRYLWNCEKISYTEGPSKIFTPALIGTHGEKGSTVEIAYAYRLHTSSSLPEDYYPKNNAAPDETNWMPEPSGVTAETPYEFVSQNKVTDGKYGNWSTPKVWAKYGSDASVNRINTFNALTNNGTNKGIYYGDSKGDEVDPGTKGAELYINASMIKTGILEVGDTSKTVFSADVGGTSVLIGGFEVKATGENSGYIARGQSSYAGNGTGNAGVYLGTDGIGLGNGAFYVKSDGSGKFTGAVEATSFKVTGTVEGVATSTDLAAVSKTATDAASSANQAKAAADSATATANGAKTVADGAVTVANGAKTVADSATVTANGAKENAANAVTVANGAQDVAGQAKTAADGATTIANGAKESAEGAVKVANDAKIAAEGAVSTADDAAKVANDAKATAAGANTLLQGWKAEDVSDKTLGIMTGNTITSGMINASKISVKHIKSANCGEVYSDTGFTAAGTLFNLEEGSIHTPGFSVTQNGNAKFKGAIEATSLTIAENVAATAGLSTKKYADSQANAAKTAAINTASSDATAKANAAQTAAISVIEDKGYQTKSQVTKITKDTVSTENIFAQNLEVNSTNIKGKLAANQIEVADLDAFGATIAKWQITSDGIVSPDGTFGLWNNNTGKTATSLVDYRQSAIRMSAGAQLITTTERWLEENVKYVEDSSEKPIIITLDYPCYEIVDIIPYDDDFYIERVEIDSTNKKKIKLYYQYMQEGMDVDFQVTYRREDYAFQFLEDGSIYAAAMKIEGKADILSSGSLAGWDYDQQGIWKDNFSAGTGIGLWSTTNHANIAIHAGATTQNIGSAPFRVYHDGSVNITKGSVEIGTPPANSGADPNYSCFTIEKDGKIRLNLNQYEHADGYNKGFMVYTNKHTSSVTHSGWHYAQTITDPTDSDNRSLDLVYDIDATKTGSSLHLTLKKMRLYFVQGIFCGYSLDAAPDDHKYITL